jgi:hypothetical protein
VRQRSPPPSLRPRHRRAARKSCTSATSSVSERCTNAYDQSIFDKWQAFEQPLIDTPGDNEWSDCTKAKEEPGSDNDDPVTHPGLPLENLALILQIFFANPGLTLGQHPMHVITQAQAFDQQDTTDANYVENVMWRQGKTEFVTLNIPGGSNNDVDPWYASHKIPASPENTSFFEKPVLYLNGDSHVYRSDDPLEQGSTCFTEVGGRAADAWNQHPFYDVRNFHRIVVHGSTLPLEWLKLAIDAKPPPLGQPAATSWGPFSRARETQPQVTP